MPKISKITDQIAYQEKSVVSRTLMDKKSGTITLFAFDEGEGLSEHEAPYDALIYILEGEAEIILSNNKYHLKTGEIIQMQANEKHSLKALKKFKMMLIMIRS